MTDRVYQTSKNKPLMDYSKIDGDSLFKNVNAFFRSKEQKKRPIVGEVKPLDEFEAKEWFTNTTDYEYIDQLLQGLNLNFNFPNAENCVLAFIGWVDQFTYVDNNLTLEYEYTEPLEQNIIYTPLNLTWLFATHHADLYPFCYEFSVEIYKFYDKQFKALNGDFNKFLINFLFTQMGNAKIFKSIIDSIEENNK